MARKRIGATAKRSIDRLQTNEIIKGIKKDEEQDKRFKSLEERIKESGSRNFDEYFKMLTEKVNKVSSDLNKEVNELYYDIYHLKQKDIKTDHDNDIQQVSIDEIKDRSLKNKSINDKQEEDIKKLKNDTDKLFDFYEVINSNIYKLKKAVIGLGIVSIVSILASVGIVIFLCL